MQETEVKILEINQQQIIGKLEKLGAKKTFEGNIDAIYFSRKSLPQKSILRLRKIGDRVELALKEFVSKDKIKTYKETEIYPKDFENTNKLLLLLGFKIHKETQKHRISYQLNKVHFEIDTIPKIPSWLEIEAPNPEILEQQVIKLGFPLEDTKPWTTKEVIEYYENPNKK